MKRSYVLMAFGVLAAVLFLMSAPFEPRHQGKTISAWIVQLTEANLTRRAEAQTALRELGPKGRSWMIRRLNREESRGEKILRGDRSNGLLTQYDLRRAMIATALGSLGPAAAPAIPALERAAQHPHWLIAARAQAALMQIRQESSAPLSQALTDTSNIGVWVKSACTLSGLGTNVNCSAFTATLQQDLSRAFDTVQLLCTNHVDPAVSGPILIACLHHKEAGVRVNTLNAMIVQRAWGNAERDAMVECIFDPDPGVRGNALFALNCFAPGAFTNPSTNLTQALRRAATDADPAVRAFAAEFSRKLPQP